MICQQLDHSNIFNTYNNYCEHIFYYSCTNTEYMFTIKKSRYLFHFFTNNDIVVTVQGLAGLEKTDGVD